MTEVIAKEKKNPNKRRIVFSVGSGALFALFLFSGFSLKHTGDLYFKSIPGYLVYFLLTAVLSAGFYFLFYKDGAFACRGKSLPSKVTRFLLPGCFLFIFLAWLVQLLGVYPGFFNYDADRQWLMYANSEVTAHHPVLHTYLVGWCIAFSYNVFKSPLRGCAIYVLIQMLITDYAYTSVLSFLIRRKVNTVFLILATLWFSFAPTVAMCVLSVTKDSMFTAFFVLFVVETLGILEKRKEEKFRILHFIVWCISAFFCAVMRNNAVYVMIPFLIFMALYLRKKQVIIGVISVILALVLYLGPVSSAITVAGVKSTEFLSVPAQQAVRVYILHKDELPEDERQMIEETFDEIALEFYVPKIADVAKGCIRQEYLQAHKTELLSLWLKLGLKYPGDYLEAFLLDNCGFWYPWMSLVLMADGTEGYYVCRSYPPVWNVSKIPIIETYFHCFEYSSVVCKNPVFMWIFAPATYFYTFLLACLYLLYHRKKDMIAMIPVLLVWMTFLLGPVALVRYVGFLYALVPLEAGLFIGTFKESESGKEE